MVQTGENAAKLKSDIITREVYVLNLDQKRIIIIAGILFILLGLAFWLGLKAPDAAGKEQPATVETFNLDSMVNPPLPNTAEAGSLADSAALASKNAELARQELNSIENRQPPGAIEENNQIPLVADPMSSGKAATGYFSVQAGVFKHEKDAIKMVRLLKQKGFDARIDKGVLYYFVRSGKENDKKSLVGLNNKISTALKIKTVIIQKKQ